MNNKLAILVAAGALAMGAQQRTQAIPTLKLTIATDGAADGSAGDLVITDNDGNDYDSLPALPPGTVDGVIAWSGNRGVFNLNVIAGSSKPAIGSALDPAMHLSLFNLSTTGAGTLTLALEDSGFIGDPLGMLSSWGGALGAAGITASFQTFINGVPLTTLQSFNGPGGFHSDTSGSISGVSPNPYDLKLVGTLTVNGAKAVSSSWDGNLSVPDGGATAALLGIAFLGLGAASRRK